MIKKSFGLRVKYPLFFTDCNETWTFRTGVRKMLKYRILWKSVQWETSCSMRADGQTDDEANRRFSQIWGRLKVTCNRNQVCW